VQAPGDPTCESAYTSGQSWTSGRHRWRPSPTCQARRAASHHPRVVANLRARPRDRACLRGVSGRLPCGSLPSTLRPSTWSRPSPSLRRAARRHRGGFVSRDSRSAGLAPKSVLRRAPGMSRGRLRSLLHRHRGPRGVRGTAAGELLDVKELTGLALSVEPTAFD
jgi:hypothetical protein